VDKFQGDLAAAAEHLRWCTTAAARLRAYLADVLGATQAALAACGAPEGLLPPFPMSLLVGGGWRGLSECNACEKSLLVCCLQRAARDKSGVLEACLHDATLVCM
jgi:hypothetical protein